MQRIIMIICAMAAIVMARAENYTHQFHSTPLPEAMQKLMESHPGLNINFIYNELENYTTSATVRADNAYDALQQIIGLNPIFVIKSDNSYYVEALQHGKYVLTGRAVSADHTPVVGATIMIMTPRDSAVLTYGITEADGHFTIPCDRQKVMGKLSCIGYETTYIHFHTTDVGEVAIPRQAVELAEVKVETTTMIDSKGRTIIYPSASDVKASSSAISLFQKLPLAGLTADPINRTLTVDGGSPMILIDGKPSDLNDFNALQPKDIAKVEYSRISPARYADNGSRGFINIMLKKRTDGGQVYLWGRSATATAFVDANVRASYHQGPSQFTLAYNPSWRNYQAVYDNTTESYIGDDFRVNLEEHDRNPFYYHTHNMKLKYDYSPDDHTLFSATFSMTPYITKRRSMAHTSDSYIGEYDNDNTAKSTDLTPSLDLFFKREFNASNTLEVEVVGTLAASDYRRTNRYDYDDGTTSEYIMDVDSRRRSLISEVNYTHDFTPKTSVSGGFQNTVSHSTNTYLSSDYKPVLTENNNYVYARLGQQMGKFYLSLSTGAKMFWVKNDLNRRSFIRNLSSAQLSWNINPQWNLSAAFQYTPSIPSLSALTDNPQQQSPYLISNGNPDLKVADIFQYQVGPSFHHKKLSAAMWLYYYNSNNAEFSDMIYLGDRMFLSQSVNAHRVWEGGGNIGMRINDIHGFGANVYLDLAHTETLGAGGNYHLTSFSASFSVWWNKGPYTISYWRKFPGKTLNGNFVGKSENGDALKFDYKPDKHWTIGASWMYMFDPKGTKYPAWGYSRVNPYYRERYIKNNGNMVVLSVSYSADFGSIFRSSRRTLNNTDTGSSLLKM